MIKRIIIFSICVLFFIGAKAQTWPQYYGGAGIEKGNSMIFINPPMMSKMAGNMIIVGSTNSIGAGGIDMYLVKTDTDGNQVDEVTFGTNNDESANTISVFQNWSDPDVSYVIGGYTSSATGKDIYISKIDSNIQEIYPPSIYTNDFGDDELNCLRFLNIGSIFGVGYKTNNSGNKDLYMMKFLDNFSNIDTSYTLSVGGNGDDVAYSIDGDINGVSAIVGYTNSYGNGGTDIYLVAFENQQQMIMYDTTYGGIGNDVAFDVIYSPVYNAFYIVGSTDSYGNGGKDIYLLKVDAYSGDTVWTRTFGGSGDEEGFDIEVQGDFFGEYYNLIITGYSTSFGAGDKDTYTIKIDPSTGDEIWSKVWGLAGVDEVAKTIKYDNCEWFISGTSGDDMFLFNFPEPKLQLTFYKDDITCNGYNDGHVFLEVISNSPVLNYWWSNLEYTEELFNLSAGMYYVQVNDGFCSSEDSIEIFEPEFLSASLEQIVIGCKDETDKVAQLNVTGGIPPYNYIWSSGGSDDIEYYLPIGGVGATVTDNNGCMNYDYFTIYDATSDLIVYSIIQTPTSCNGYCDGLASVQVIGGGGEYQYLWDDVSSQTDSVAIGLCSDGYSVTITDSYQCNITIDTIYIDEPDIPYIETDIVEPTCNGLCDGSISVTYIDGIFPFSYNWEFGGTDSLITSLCAGDINLSITDGNGCIHVATFSLSEPELITSNTSVNNVLCEGMCDGIISLNIVGGTAPYSYNWSNGQYSDIINSLCVGMYSVTVIDANSCNTELSYNVATNSIITVNSNVSNILCNGQSTGAILIIPSGGTSPYTYSWNNGSTSNSLNGLVAGTYIVTTTDINGCIKTATVSVTEPYAIQTSISNTDAGCDNSCTGSSVLSTIGGTTPYNYTWSNGLTSSIATSLCAGYYIVTIKDVYNCLEVKSISINIQNTSTINGFVQNSISNFNSGAISILLYKGNTNNQGFTNISTITNTTGGLYSFSGLTSGRYYIKAKVVDITNYPNVLNTYYPNSLDWQLASEINIACDSIYNYNIMTQNKVVGTTGGTSISGKVAMSIGSKSILGEPVPGADITLEQEPDDEPISNTTTNENGDFVFNNVGAGIYSLRVDIAGLPQIDTLSFNITNDTSLVNMNYLIDTSSTNFGIYIDPQTSVNNYNFENFSVSVYPVPAKEELNISFDIVTQSNFIVDIIDITGKNVYRSNYIYLNHGTFSEKINISKIKAGVYYIKIKSEKSVLFKKIIKI